MMAISVFRLFVYSERPHILTGHTGDTFDLLFLSQIFFFNSFFQWSTCLPKATHCTPQHCKIKDRIIQQATSHQILHVKQIHAQKKGRTILSSVISLLFHSSSAMVLCVAMMAAAFIGRKLTLTVSSKQIRASNDRSLLFLCVCGYSKS